MGIKSQMRRWTGEKKELEVVRPPDGGWGWVVCAAAFVIQFFVLGIMNSFAILYVRLFDEFGKKALETSLVGSINYGMMFFMGPVAAAMAAKYGCRRVSMAGSIIFAAGFLSSSYATHIHTLFFTYGVVIGFGASLCYFSSLVAVGQYFYLKLSLANGIISSGSGVGTLVFGPIMNNLLKQLGWRWTLRVYAGMAVVVFLCAILYRPINSSVLSETDRRTERPKQKFIDFTVFRNKAYVIWCTALAVFILGYFLPFVHLVKYARNNGVSDDESSFLIGILSVGSTFGRLFFGHISDHPKVNRLYVYQMSILFMGVANTLLPLMKSYATIVLYCVVWGTFEGCYVALCAVLTADIVGKHKLSSGVGILFGIKSIPLTGGPALAGVVYDLSQSYDVAFYIAGAVCTLCCCVMFLIPFNMPEAGDGVVEVGDAVDSLDCKKTVEYDLIRNGKLENGKSDDSAYVSDQASTSYVALRPRPHSSYLSPCREPNLVVSPSTLSVRQSLSRSASSLTGRYLQPLSKKAKSSEFGSMTSIPFIPNSGSYRFLQQIPVATSPNQESRNLNENRNAVVEDFNVAHEQEMSTNIPSIVIGDDSEMLQDINKYLCDISLVSQIPGKETDL